jgi:hypothetical protein
MPIYNALGFYVATFEAALERDLTTSECEAALLAFTSFIRQDILALKNTLNKAEIKNFLDSHAKGDSEGRAAKVLGL